MQLLLLIGVPLSQRGTVVEETLEMVQIEKQLGRDNLGLIWLKGGETKL